MTIESGWAATSAILDGRGPTCARRMGLHRLRSNSVCAGLDGGRRRRGTFAVQGARLDHGKDEQDGPEDGVDCLSVDVASAGAAQLKSAQRTFRRSTPLLESTALRPCETRTLPGAIGEPLYAAAASKRGRLRLRVMFAHWPRMLAICIALSRVTKGSNSEMNLSEVSSRTSASRPGAGLASRRSAIGTARAAAIFSMLGNDGQHLPCSHFEMYVRGVFMRAAS
jgi:hypothetical protein